MQRVQYWGISADRHKATQREILQMYINDIVESSPEQYA
jgi:hypothetical protein